MLYRAATALVTGLLLVATLTRSGQAAGLFDAGTADPGTTPSTADAHAPYTLTTYAGGSRVLEEALFSPTLDLHTSYRVLLPADYDTSARRYPVLYMLHGVAGDSNEWQSIGLLEAADRMVQRGQIDPFLIVLPNGGGNYWVNQATGARWADYVVNDVVGQVDRDFRTMAAECPRYRGPLDGRRGGVADRDGPSGRVRRCRRAQSVAAHGVRPVCAGAPSDVRRCPNLALRDTALAGD